MTTQIKDDGSAWWSSSPEPMPQAANDAAGLEGVRLVLVDDDEIFREAAVLELTARGFAVTAFADGPEMLRHLERGNEADLAVLDWRLPGMSGLDLLAEMRERGIDLSVVFLTGLPATGYECAALDHGAVDFVDKSRGADVLVKRLRLAVEASRSRQPRSDASELRVGRLTLRIKVGRACWDDADVGLTVTEFNILRLLAGQAGEYMTYRALYDCVHREGFVAGSGEEGFRTNVRSSMKRIRNKFRALDHDFDEIENFPGFGYRWRGGAKG
jgi:two-component system response regulator ChvI